MTEKRTLVGIVVKADGTVPFDDDCPDNVRGAILAHLADHGHTVQPVHGTRHVKIAGWKQGQKIERS